MGWDLRGDQCDLSDHFQPAHLSSSLNCLYSINVIGSMPRKLLVIQHENAKGAASGSSPIRSELTLCGGDLSSSLGRPTKARYVGRPRGRSHLPRGSTILAPITDLKFIRGFLDIFCLY